MKYLFVIIFGCFISHFHLLAQVEMPVESFDASAEITYGAAFLSDKRFDANNLDAQGNPQFLNQQVTLIGLVEPVQNGIALLEIELQDIASNTIILTKSYEYDNVPEDTGNGVSYSRNGDSFVLGLGLFSPPLQGEYKYQFKIIDTAGNPARVYSGTTLIQ